MKNIILVTGNKEKVKQITQWMAELDPSITIETQNISLLEYQTLDVRSVALGKAREAWQLFKLPVLIDDVGIYLEQYHLFPGVLTKYVYEGIGLKGVQILAKENPAAYFLCCLAYMDGPESYHFFEGVNKGTILQTHQAAEDPNVPYPAIFQPLGATTTLDRIRGTQEEKLYHHRYKALVKFVDWLASSR